MIAAETSARQVRETAAPLPDPLAAWSRHAVSYGSGEPIRADGEVATFVLRGWACRSRRLPDGRKQILDLLLPGDHYAWLDSSGGEGDFLAGLGSCRVVNVPLPALAESPAMRERMAAAERRRIAQLEERLVSLGQRSAAQRTAHFFCELLTRLGSEASPARCEFRMRQVDLADVLGLSNVHVNRTVQALRRAKLVEIKSGELLVQNFQALATYAAFSPNYLR